MSLLNGVLAVKMGPKATPLPLAVGSYTCPCPSGQGVPNGPSASIILHVCASVLILEVADLVLIWQKTSRQCGQQVCQGETDDFLKERKDSAVGGPELGPREGERLAQGFTVRSTSRLRCQDPGWQLCVPCPVELLHGLLGWNSWTCEVQGSPVE